MFGYLDAAVRFGLQVLGYRAHVDFSQLMRWIVPTGCPLAPHSLHVPAITTLMMVRMTVVMVSPFRLVSPS